MAKQALLDVLEKTIGKYVLNLDAQSLNVAVWSGKIELNALQLDCDAVNAELGRQAAEAPNLAIPFKVTDGVFEHFQVEVPWAHLMSRSVILRASGLQVTVEPYDHTATSDFLYTVHETEEVRAQKVRDMRYKSLDLADEYRQQANALRELAEQDLETTTNSQRNNNETDSSFGARLVRRIIENIQIEIENVSVQVQGADCSAGLLLNSLSLQTTDKNGNVAFVDRTKKSGDELNDAFLYKVMRISGLGIYLDESRKTIQHLPSIEEDSTDSLQQHSYVLAPLSFEAQLRQADSNECIDYPKYLLTSKLQSLSMLLSRKQLELASMIAEQIRPAANIARPLFPEYRPLSHVTKKSAKDWWKYAFRCVGRLNGRRSWVEFFRAFQRRKSYIPLYKRFSHSIDCPWMKPLSTEEQNLLDEIENDRTISVEGIMAWRNVADAQAKKEKEKHEASKVKTKKSVFSSLFGSPTEESATSTDEAPISLSIEELQELEALTREQVADAELSAESRLCDLQFILGSLRISLSCTDQRPLTTLEMGTVSTSFDANQDGSYRFSLALSNLEVQDRFTPKTLFPSILKNQPGSAEETKDAFSILLSKERTGDQRLIAKLNTFEIIASPTLLLELKSFIKLANSPTGQSKSTVANPLLAQSLSGSIDLFYDATEGLSNEDNFAKGLLDQTQQSPAIQDISNALIDAWKTKTKTKASLFIDLDIQAPIIIVPESCVQPLSNVLIFDLGHLNIQYGKKDPSAKIAEWFQANQRKDPKVRPVVEHGSVNISNLTFTVGKANYWRRLVSKLGSNKTPEDDEAIVEPISLFVDLGIESTTVDESPRVCAMGVLPTVCLSLSPKQLSRTLKVTSAWQKVLSEMTPEKEENLDDKSQEFSASLTPINPSIKQEKSESGTSEQRVSLPSSKKDLSTSLYVDMRLQRISLKVVTNGGSRMEAHLVSAFASMTRLVDGSSRSNLSMGWFWLLDRLENDFPREQRLIVHSKLPVSSVELAKMDYDILGHLGKQGVFDDNFSGSKDLADIVFSQSPPGSTFGPQDPFEDVPLDKDMYDVSSVLDANFSSLNINWNPRAVKAILGALNSFSDSLKTAVRADRDGLILPTPSEIRQRRPSNASDFNGETPQVPQTSTMLVRATMDGFNISLNSALDDMPLFTLAMASTNAFIVSRDNGNTRLDLSLGELKVFSPKTGRTDPMYQKILGLASGKSESLLTIRYYSGPAALMSVRSTDEDLSECEAFGKICLSPMRTVFIQAQILALVEYATAGILGAITAQAASSAARVAADIAATEGLKKIFVIKATGLELLLPQAACEQSFIISRVGSMDLKYVGLPDSSSRICGSLAGMTMHDTEDNGLLDEPLRLNADITMPVVGVGSKEDQAMRVSLVIPKASFVLSKAQYAQILATLDKNIGEEDLFVRPTSAPVLDTVESDIDKDIDNQPLTHAGVSAIQEQRRVNFSLDVNSLSLMICGVDQNNPIVQVAAINSVVIAKTMPDEQRLLAKVTLQDLACDDRRISALSRQYRSLVYQPKVDETDTEKTSHDVFVVSYEAFADNKSSIDLKIGSPRMVFIPDVLSDILSFLDVERVKKDPTSALEKQENYREIVKIEDNFGEDSGIEAAMVQAPETAALNLTLKTAQCSVLLVDLGSNAVRQGFQSSRFMGSVAETIVIGGSFEGKYSTESNKMNGSTVKMDLEFHGEDIESYTAFGRDLHSAVQILDPTKVSFYISSAAKPRKVTDIRCATISPVDLTVSMRNIALFNAVAASLSDCLEERKNEQEETKMSLTREEEERMTTLASALANVDEVDVSSHSLETSTAAPSTDAISRKPDDQEAAEDNEIILKLTTPNIRVTLVNDLQGLDEALLRVSVDNLVANGHVQEGVRNSRNSKRFTAFDFNFHTAVLADFYDTSTNTWKTLLLRPWEVSSKCNRGSSQRFQSDRPSTTIDVESLPCHMSFSEQFLMSLASANRMWAVYSGASSSALESLEEDARKSNSLRKSLAASAARTFISSLPYAVENHLGVDVEVSINGERKVQIVCGSGSLEYFRFEPPAGEGSGGKRLYGQDVAFEKKIEVMVGDSIIEIPHLDFQLGKPRKLHKLESGNVVVTEVVKEGKTISVRLSSGIYVNNESCIDFSVSAISGTGEITEVGTCLGAGSPAQRGRGSRRLLNVENGKLSRTSGRFGIPLKAVAEFRREWTEKKVAEISFSLSPMIDSRSDSWKLIGSLDVRAEEYMFNPPLSSKFVREIEVICRPQSSEGKKADPPRDLFPFVFLARISISLIGSGSEKYPVVDISLAPRVSIENRLPITLTLKSPMPHVICPQSRKQQQQATESEDSTTHIIEQKSSVEIFTPGPSIAVMFKCTDTPVGGTTTDWIDGGWIDLPLTSNFRSHEPIECSFPFTRKSSDPLALDGARGSKFLIAQGSAGLAYIKSKTKARQEDQNKGSNLDNSGVEVSLYAPDDEAWRTFYVLVETYGVDHTGDILFEQVPGFNSTTLRKSSSGIDTTRRSRASQLSPPFGAYSSKRYRGRISLLPDSNVPIRLLHLTMEGEEGLRRSAPFKIDDISICDGGIDSSAVRWEDGKLSGFFAYRHLISPTESEVHVIPEFVVFNGCEKFRVFVRQPGGNSMHIDPGKIAPLRSLPNVTPTIVVEYPELRARTPPLRIDSLGLKISVLKTDDGRAIASFAMQVVIGASDSKFVVKLGEIKFGSLVEDKSDPYSTLKDDFLRFRIRWSELQMTLYEARPISEERHAFIESAMDRIQKTTSGSSHPVKKTSFGSQESKSRPETWVEARERQAKLRGVKEKEGDSSAVCTILFSRFTVDFQRVFKDQDEQNTQTTREKFQSAERSQFAVVIHNIQIRDESPETPYPIVFDSTSNQISFFDLCIRFRGDVNSDLVQISLLDINLAHANGVTEKIYVNTNEDFIWKTLDLADRILAAAAEFAGVDIQLKWDEETQEYAVVVREKKSYYLEEETKYVPPQSDKIYDIKKAKVSPIKLVVSFKRNPQSSRYKILRGVRGASVMNYFTRRLKFKIDKAELNFKQYEASDVKGPPDRIVELLTAVYLSQMKRKAVTIMTAASFQDWKFLASRETGNDEFVEGDIMRATGNIAGNTVGYVLGQTGRGLGAGVSTFATNVGGGIESATTALGVGMVGAGVNSVVSGVGTGVGDTITGFGTGAGRALKGAGQGVGQVFGGVTGGATMMGKGIIKGITTGDGRAAASGIVQGAQSLGTGVGQGVESVVTGATEGVLHVGQGLFSGVKNVGLGIGGAFSECCCCFSYCCCHGEEDNSNNNTGVRAPLLPRGSAN